MKIDGNGVKTTEQIDNTKTKQIKSSVITNKPKN